MLRFFVRRPQALLLVLALTVIVTQGATAQAPHGAKSKLYVLSIGVADAQGQKVIEGAEIGARVNDSFWAAQEGKLYDVVERKLILNKDATKEAILAALAKLFEEIEPGATVVIYLAGHGGDPREGGEWVFCAYDGTLSKSDLRAGIAKLAHKAGCVIMIIESCFSGAFDVDEPNVVIFAAASAEQPSWQFRDERGNPYTVFTRAVMVGLLGLADADGDGTVTIAELEFYVIERVEREAKKELRLHLDPTSPRKQNPVCRRPRSVAGDRPLARTGSPDAEFPPAFRRAA